MSSRKDFFASLNRGDSAGALRAAQGRRAPDPRHPAESAPFVRAALGRDATNAELDAADRRAARRATAFSRDEEN